MDGIPKEENLEDQLLVMPTSGETQGLPHFLNAEATDDFFKEEDRGLDNIFSALRPRGTYASTTPRIIPKTSFSFDKCNMCNTNLAGCITDNHTMPNDNRSISTILTCGHVVCLSCLEKIFSPSTNRHQYKCQLCHEFVAKIKLPSRDSVNFTPCQAPYCSGEAFDVPQDRCITCQRLLCESCVVQHSQRFPRGDHIIEKRREPTKSSKFAKCSFHHESVHARCTCGEMVCKHCESTDPDERLTRGQMNHVKIPFDEVDLLLEDSMQDVSEIVKTLKRMRQSADMKQKELAEMVDRMNNEIAIHFNQIILQAIQRCFDVMNAVKMSAVPHYEQLADHIKHVLTLERKLLMGLTIDERARDRTRVTAESVANYTRHASYALCGPALQQIQQAEAEELHYASCKYSIVLPKIDTVSIMENIGNWGEAITAEFSLVNTSNETLLDPTSIMPVLSMHDGTPIRSVSLKGQLDAKVLPLRLHSALDHFTEIFERRFNTVSSPVDAPKAVKRILPFQLGERNPPEATYTHREVADRFTYEKSVLSRVGVMGTMNLGPKVFGGYKNIYNLRNTAMKTREIQETYSRTPTIPPIWNLSDGEHRRARVFLASTQRSRPVPQLNTQRAIVPSIQQQHRLLPVTGSNILRKNNMVLIRRDLPLIPPTNKPKHQIAPHIAVKSVNSVSKNPPARKIKNEEEDDIKVESVTLRDPTLPPYTPPLPLDPIFDYKLESIFDEELGSQPSTSNNSNGSARYTVPTKLPVKQIVAPRSSQYNGSSYRGGPMYQQEKGERFRESTTHRIAQPGRAAFPVLWQTDAPKPQEWPPRRQDGHNGLIEQRELADNVDGPHTITDRAAWRALSEREREKRRSTAIAKSQKFSAMRQAHEECSYPDARPYHGEEDHRKEKRRLNGQDSSEDLLAAPGGGCFVCNLHRNHQGRPRTWQCNECVRVGRALTPLNEEEMEKERSMAKRRRFEETDNNRNRSTSKEDEDMEEEPEVRRSGRARKAPKKFD